MLALLSVVIDLASQICNCAPRCLCGGGFVAIPNHTLLCKNVTKLLHNNVMILWLLPCAVSSAAPFEHPTWSYTQGTWNCYEPGAASHLQGDVLIVMPLINISISDIGMPVANTAWQERVSKGCILEVYFTVSENCSNCVRSKFISWIAPHQ
jgi:hypothetical protein